MTKCIGTAARRKASVMLRRSWQAGLLQPEAAKRIVTAARQVVSDHSATLVLCGIAAGCCQMHCNGCRSNRRASWEAGQGSSSDKWVLRKEVAERRGASAKRSLSEEVAHKGKELTHSLPPSLAPSLSHSLARSLTHPLTHSLTHSLTRSLTLSLTHSLAHSLAHSLTH